MNKDSKIYVAGNRGLVGSAITAALRKEGYNNLVFTPHAQYDLIDTKTVEAFFEKERPEYVFQSAAHVGGIIANLTYRADFIYQNLMIESNIIHAAYKYGAKKLLFLGSSCIYPKNPPQPMTEDVLLTSELEYTNEPYALSKIAGIKLCESYNLQYGTNFISVMPTNLYGPNDNYNLETSHVMPAMIRKFHLAKCLENNDFEAIKKDLDRRPIEGVSGASPLPRQLEVIKKYGIGGQGKDTVVELWGDGSPRREFLHSQDLGEACVFLMENVDFADILRKQFNITDFAVPYTKTEVRNTHINIGTGKDLRIKELADMVKSAVGYTGKVVWNSDKPNGTPQKLLDVSKLEKLGWKYTIELSNGIASSYNSYLKDNVK
ncbi:MAG: GDP-L-fucose synthase [Bacteroidales bacterium]|nr:GDP-L-fucose synthase [Bacteroidales bacterium]